MLSRPLAIAMLFAIALAGWLALLAGLGHSGWPQRMILHRASCFNESFAAAHRLYQASGMPAVDVVVAGTADFTDAIAAALPGKRIVAVPLATPSPREYAGIVTAFASRAPRWIVLQNVPHFWTDFDQRYVGGFQDLSLLQLDETPFSVSGLYADAVLTVVAYRNFIRAWAEGCTPAQPALPDRFLWTSMLPEPMLSARIGQFTRAIGPEDAANVLWVADPAWIPGDAAAETRDALIRFMQPGSPVPNLGRFVDRDDLAAIVAP